MNISVQAFPTILISLTVLGLAGCIPAYYTREDGLKMSTAERQSLCERLSARTKFRCETQPAHMQGLCYEVNKNAGESLVNLECSRVLDVGPTGLTLEDMMMQERMVKFELAKAMNIPPNASGYIPKEWTWESRDTATPDLTGTEWVAWSSTCVLACPKTLRFLPKGRLVVSRDWVIYEKSLGKLPEYGRAEEGRWSQKQTRIYLQFKVEKPGEKDPKAVTLHGFGNVSVRNVNGRKVLWAELSLTNVDTTTMSEWVSHEGGYEITRR